MRGMTHEQPIAPPIRSVRKDVLGVTQKQFAEIAGVSQASVSRWEDGALFPSSDEMARIREFAITSRKPWNDSWFFEAPNLVNTARRLRRGAA
jgi:predicted transcriptional regulator